MLPRLNKPLKRRIDERLVATFTKDGVELRGYRCRKRLFASWSQIAAVADSDTPIEVISDERLGRAAMQRINALFANT